MRFVEFGFAVGAVGHSKLMSPNEYPAGGCGDTDVLLKLRTVENTHEITGIRIHVIIYEKLSIN